MNIFNSLNLNHNTIDFAVLGDWGNSDDAATGTAGAIRYKGSALQFHNGSSWQTVGTSQGMSSFSVGAFGSSATGSGFTVSDGNTINFGLDNNQLVIKKGTSTTGQIKVTLPSSTPGPISVYTQNSFPATPGTTNVAPITIGTNSGPAADNSIQIKGDGKGKVSFNSTYNSSAYSVNTTIVKILYTNIYVASNQTSKDYTIQHSLGTENILVNTYYAKAKSGTTYEVFSLIQCEVEITDDSNIKVKLRGDTIPEGVLKVVIYGGAEESLGTSAVYYLDPTDTPDDRDGVPPSIDPTQKIPTN